MKSCHCFLTSIRFGTLFLSEPLYCMQFFMIFFHHYSHLPLFFIPEILIYYTGCCSTLDPRTLLPFQICENRWGLCFFFFFLVLPLSFYSFSCFWILYLSLNDFFQAMYFHFIIFQSPELCNITGIVLFLKMSFVKSPLLFSMHYVACTVVTTTVFYFKCHCNHSKNYFIKHHKNLAFLQFILPCNSSRVYCLLPWYQHQVFVLLLCSLAFHNLVIPFLSLNS